MGNTEEKLKFIKARLRFLSYGRKRWPNNEAISLVMGWLRARGLEGKITEIGARPEEVARMLSTAWDKQEDRECHKRRIMEFRGQEKKFKMQVKRDESYDPPYPKDPVPFASKIGNLLKTKMFLEKHFRSREGDFRPLKAGNPYKNNVLAMLISDLELHFTKVAGRPHQGLIRSILKEAGFCIKTLDHYNKIRQRGQAKTPRMSAGARERRKEIQTSKRKLHYNKFHTCLRLFLSRKRSRS